MSLKLKFAAATIIVCSTVLAITSFWNDSVIIDEVPHIGAGYSYLAKLDYRLNPEHPPLAKALSAVPLMFMDIGQDVFLTKFWLTDLNGQWEFGRRLIFNSGNDADKITRAVKMPMLLFFISASILIFIWTYHLAGGIGAICALILFAFSPTVVAHSRFVTTDLAALWGVLFSTYFFVRYLRYPTSRNMFYAEVAFGFALLAKFSTFLLIPALGLTAVLWGFSNGTKIKEKLYLAIFWGFRSVFVFIIGFVIVVWPIYYILTYNYPPERQYADTQAQLATFGKRYMADPVVWMSDKPVLRGAGHYLLGFLMVVQRSAGGNTIYYLGQVLKQGGPLYFPVVYMIKEPLAWWVLAIISLLIIANQTKGALPHDLKKISSWIKEHIEIVAMLIWLGAYWYVSIRSTLNIGIRHMLPVFPFMMILVSIQISWLSGWLKRINKTRARNFVLIVVLLLTWFVAESVGAWPYYLTYFNQLAGGPQGGHRFVVDSNLDWGQDLKRFGDWVNERKIEKIALDYFGWADPYYYIGDKYVWVSSHTFKDARDFMENNQSNGWIAVSASFLQGSIGSEISPEVINYYWLKAYEPEAVIGNSIWIWHIEPYERPDGSTHKFR